jgi:hypothetical protein
MARRRKESKKCMYCHDKDAVVTKTVRGLSWYHTIRPRRRLIKGKINSRFELYDLCLDCLYKDNLVHSEYCMGMTFDEFKNEVERLLGYEKP